MASKRLSSWFAGRILILNDGGIMQTTLNSLHETIVDTAYFRMQGHPSSTAVSHNDCARGAVRQAVTPNKLALVRLLALR